jgi:hypothetical protein
MGEVEKISKHGAVGGFAPPHPPIFILYIKILYL